MKCRHLLAEFGTHEVSTEIVEDADPLTFGRYRHQPGIDQWSLVSRVGGEELAGAGGPQREERIARRGKDRVDLFDEGTQILEAPRRRCGRGRDLGIDFGITEGRAIGN